MIPTMTRNKAGTAMVDMRKARPRICSRNSRRAIRKILRIGFASHGQDEDLFERRLDQFKAINRSDDGGFVEQFLRVAVGLELDFGVAGKVFGLGDLVTIQERGVALELDDHPVALI